MSTISSQCVDAIVTKLNEASGRPTGLETVARCRLSNPTTDEELPSKKWIFVRTGPSDITPVGSMDGPVRQNELRVLIEAIAVGDASTPADAAADILVAWCTKKLDGQSLSHLAEQVVEVSREPTYGQGKYPSCRMTLTYVVYHTSRTGDAEQRT